MSIKLFRRPIYTRLKLELPGERVDTIESFVEFVRTLGAWEAENASLDNVLEFIVESHLSGSSPEARDFKKWKTNRQDESESC